MGLIFDIKEFALNDGSGIRTTVFFKGCPLRCAWCHNPEGLSPRRELYIKQKGCTHCGLCRKQCSHPTVRGWDGVCTSARKIWSPLPGRNGTPTVLRSSC